MKPKKKSLVGWMINVWDLAKIEHPCVQDIFLVRHDNVYSLRTDCEDMNNLPQGNYKAVKVRITIEELQ